jgi:uncharacterized iron-regulated membrane protein
LTSVNLAPDGKGNMGRRILVIVLLLILAGFAYVGYNSYDAKRAEASGDVFSKDSPADRTKTNTGVAGESKASEQPATVNPAAVPAEPTPAAPDATAQAGGSAGTTTGADAISPNPPNGMVFSGTGHYQLYRQGNLTWRLNTDTGQTCILFATDEEWKKAKVYRNGCGGKR